MTDPKHPDPAPFAGPRYEYRVVALTARGTKAREQEEALLCQHGAEGWRLVCMREIPGSGQFAYFERPLPAAEPVAKPRAKAVPPPAAA